MMTVIKAADQEMQKGLSDIASALTSLASGKTANSSITNSSLAGTKQIQVTLARKEVKMGQMKQTITAQQAQIAATAQQQPRMMPMMPCVAPTLQRQPLQPVQMNSQYNAPANNPSNNTRGNNNNGRVSNPKHPIKRYKIQNYCHQVGSGWNILPRRNPHTTTPTPFH